MVSQGAVGERERARCHHSLKSCTPPQPHSVQCNKFNKTPWNSQENITYVQIITLSKKDVYLSQASGSLTAARLQGHDF